MGNCAAELFVDVAMIDYVVTVGASGCGLEIGRAVDVRDAEFVQILRDVCGVVEGEVLVKLETVGRLGSSGHSLAPVEHELLIVLAFARRNANRPTGKVIWPRDL